MIDASVPVLREHGLAITRVFYSNMFSEHPELKHVFNMGNQANGAQQQSLAAAVFAYAANISQPAALAPVVERIAHKHAAVGIKPAHYPIVARHLLGAIRQVLGDAATPALLAAWDEAYWLLAGELIAAEARLYERSGRDAGERMPLVVREVTRESDEAIALSLQAPDGSSPGAFAPGQYVSVAVELTERKLRQLRQYSLCGSPHATTWRICVKREDGREAIPAGAVSNYLHTHIRPGDALSVSAAFGNFTPPTDRKRPLALISAGVGMTPMMAVLEALPAHSGQPVLFAHAAQSASKQVLTRELARAQARIEGLTTMLWHEHCEPGSEARSGRMTLTKGALAPFEEADFYLCGPLPFMQEQWKALIALGISPSRLHREVFGPDALDHLL